MIICTKMLSSICRNHRRRLFGLTTILAASSSVHHKSLALSSTVAPTSTTNICNARHLGNSDLIVSEACLGTMVSSFAGKTTDMHVYYFLIHISCTNIILYMFMFIIIHLF